MIRPTRKCVQLCGIANRNAGSIQAYLSNSIVALCAALCAAIGNSPIPRLNLLIRRNAMFGINVITRSGRSVWKCRAAAITAVLCGNVVSIDLAFACSQ